MSQLEDSFSTKLGKLNRIVIPKTTVELLDLKYGDIVTILVKVNKKNEH